MAASSRRGQRAGAILRSAVDEYVPADGPLRRALLAVIDSDKPDSGEPDLLAELGLPQAQDSRSAPAKTEQHGMISLKPCVDELSRGPAHGKVLSLMLGRIGPEGARQLARVLASGALAGSLRAVDLSGCNLAGFSGDTVAVSSLFAALGESQPGLTWLSVAGNLLTATAASALGAAVVLMPRIRVLDLSRNNLRAGGAIAIAEALDPSESPLSCLEHLSLAENGIGIDVARPGPSARAAMALAGALGGHPCLRSLDLSNNGLPASAVAPLAAALATSSTLVDLRLDGNAVDPDGALALAGLARAVPSLTRLGLRGTSVLGDGAAALAEAMEASPALSVLDLRDASVAHHGRVRLARAVLPHCRAVAAEQGRISSAEEQAAALADAHKAAAAAAEGKAAEDEDEDGDGDAAGAAGAAAASAPSRPVLAAASATSGEASSAEEDGDDPTAALLAHFGLGKGGAEQRQQRLEREAAEREAAERREAELREAELREAEAEAEAAAAASGGAASAAASSASGAGVVVASDGGGEDSDAAGAVEEREVAPDDLGAMLAMAAAAEADSSDEEEAERTGGKGAGGGGGGGTAKAGGAARSGPARGTTEWLVERERGMVVRFSDRPLLLVSALAGRVVLC